MRLRLRRLLPLFLLLCVLVLPAAAPAVQPGQMLVPFKGTDLDGQPFDLAESIGKRPVMLVFWASWCPSCRTEVPKINDLAARYGKRGMAFVAVNVGSVQGVKRGYTFEIFDGATYKGQVRIEFVHGDMASGLITRTVPGQSIRQGDGATTRL